MSTTVIWQGTTDSYGEFASDFNLFSILEAYGHFTSGDSSDGDFELDDNNSIALVVNGVSNICTNSSVHIDNGFFMSGLFLFGEYQILNYQHALFKEPEGYVKNATIELVHINQATKFIEESGLARAWQNIKNYIDQKEPAIEVEGNWNYRIYNDGSYEAWYGGTGETVEITAQSGSVYRSDRMTLTLPSKLTAQGTTEIISFNLGVGHNNYPTWTAVASKTNTQINYYVLSGSSRAQNKNYTVSAYVYGSIQKG